MIAGCRIDQLRGDAKIAAELPDAAFDNELDAELARHTPDIDGLVTKLERRIAGDDEQ
jgi:hypothetical protein